MRTRWLLVLAAPLAACATLASGCLNLDDFTIVSSDGGTSSATTTTSSTGTGGGSCNGPASTTFVSFLAPAGSTGNGTDPCSATSSEPGIELMALDASSGNCISHARIIATGATLESVPRIEATNGSTTVVAGTYKGGPVRFPSYCSVGGDVVLMEAPNASASIFVAALALENGQFCTSWARSAFSTDAGAALRVNAVDASSGGRVAIAGTLGGAHATFDGGGAMVDVAGTAFFAEYEGAGTLVTAVTLPASEPGDSAFGLASRNAAWLVTGSVHNADPTCHACSGFSNVVDNGSSCAPGSGTGGGGGAGGAGGSGGMGTGGQKPDTENAFFWEWDGPGACAVLGTFGSDHAGSTDAQLGGGIWVSQTSKCSAYWTGLAGLEAWPFDGTSPSSTLPAGDGMTLDAFNARIDGLMCGSGGIPWLQRLVPSVPGSIASGHRVAGNHCADGEVSSTRVHGASGGRVDVTVCRSDGSCAMESKAPLVAGATDQLLVLGSGADGHPDWSSAFGPVATDDATLPTARSHSDLVSDGHDDAYLVFTTDGPLHTENVELFGCDTTLIEGAPAGTWVVSLQAGGFGEKSLCRWVRRFGP